MEKIAYIVPDKKWIPFIEDIIKEDVQSGQVDVQTLDVSCIRSEYRRLCAEGYGLIIARGGTFLELMQVADTVRVLEVRVQTSDVLIAVKECMAHYTGKIYVVLHQKVAGDFEKTVSLYNFPIEVRRYGSQIELGQQIDSIPDSNVTVLTSGIAEKVTKRKDLRLEHLLTREESVRNTVERAKDFLSQKEADRRRVNLVESIFANVDEGIIIFEQNGIVHEMNLRAEQMLGIPMDDLVGNDISTAIADMTDNRTGGIYTGFPKTFLHQRKRTMLSVSVSPFLYNREENRFILTLQDVTKIQEAERNIRQKLAKKGLTADYRFQDILTVEPAMKRLIARAESIAGYDGSVLIYGENGTGKELFAQSIHNESRRKDGPFVAVNCAALAESLLESELFGYVGGAFTGARKEGKAGLFELAHEGTIFLDEINSMPLNLQAKILRVIEQQEVMRVGSDYVIPLNVRIIAASNQPLPDIICSGGFRKDLYFRLNTFEIHIPAMNERKKDILLLFRHYLAQLEGVTPDQVALSEDFEKELAEHDWWGNVREIRSTALRYHAFAGDNSGGDILKNESREGNLVDDNFKIDLPELNRTVESLVIHSLLEKGMTKTEIADALGISRQALYKKLNAYSEK